MTTPVVLITGALTGIGRATALAFAQAGARLIEKGTLRMVMRTINGATAMSLPVVGSRNVLKKNALRFAAALLVALASFVAAPNAALTQAPQHHDQVPGFYRQKVGDLEVTALFDGHAVFDPHWLNGTKATMDGVVEALHEDPRLLDVSDEGFLVNTGKKLILVDAGAAPGGVEEHSGVCSGAFAVQVTRRKKSTSFWSRTFIPITSAA
jgi:hypothetical protein